ncbi:VOC family protein [Emticicia sp. 21SJ11W-3]|uniref:VOC family protein n=1 Tax=Emticicia sp. 21SJ11W-3 TaxID=2916755 RepID=UPI0020A0DEDE|nr:VOC family protein [Emticicia sp. 21SJ11W-3]UTA66577.1 VOC family protein [Emticicia sp. 21SJ11W-3]
MTLQLLRPVLYTEEMEETLQFYTEVLGFGIDNYEAASGWASVSKDEVSLMLSLPFAHRAFSKPVFTGSFYFHTTQVDALWEKLKAKAQVCYAPETFSYGMREFAVYDNNGYLLQFGEEVRED